MTLHAFLPDNNDGVGHDVPGDGRAKNSMCGLQPCVGCNLKRTPAANAVGCGTSTVHTWLWPASRSASDLLRVIRIEALRSIVPIGTAC